MCSKIWSLLVAVSMDVLSCSSWIYKYKEFLIQQNFPPTANEGRWYESASRTLARNDFNAKHLLSNIDKDGNMPRRESINTTCRQLPNCHVSLKGFYGAFVNDFPNPLTPLIIHTVVNVFNLQSSDTRDLKINCEVLWKAQSHEFLNTLCISM